MHVVVPTAAAGYSFLLTFIPRNSVLDPIENVALMMNEHLSKPRLRGSDELTIAFGRSPPPLDVVPYTMNVRNVNK
jgi:hypothetical protein